jgi:hypothetical protein
MADTIEFTFPTGPVPTVGHDNPDLFTHGPGTDNPVDILTWAKTKLSAEELANFLAAQARQDAIFEAAVTAGKVTRTVNTKTVVIPEENAVDAGDINRDPVTGEVQVWTGTTLTFNEPVESDLEFSGFYDRYKADPDLSFPS